MMFLEVSSVISVSENKKKQFSFFENCFYSENCLYSEKKKSIFYTKDKL